MPTVLFGVTVSVTAQAFLRDQLSALAHRDWQVHLATSPDRGFEALTDLPGVRVHALPMRRGPAPLADVRSLIGWRRLIRQVRPDVVVASTPKAGLLATLAARQQGVPVRLYHVRGLRAEGLSGPARAVSMASERISVASATDVLCDSESLRRAMQREGLLPEGRGVVLGHGSCCGVDTEHFRPPTSDERRDARAMLGFDETDTVVGFVGRLTADKGVAELVRAVDAVLRDKPRVRLALVGPVEGADLAPVIDAAVAAGWAVATGAVSDPRDAYWAFDVFCLPSRREGFPISPLEAQASGLPVVTTTATGCVDSIEAGVTGLTVEPDDVPALAEALRSLAGDEERARVMGEAARDRAIRNFGQGEVRQRFVEYLGELWQRRGTAPSR